MLGLGLGQGLGAWAGAELQGLGDITKSISMVSRDFYRFTFILFDAFRKPFIGYLALSHIPKAIASSNPA